MLLNYKLKGMNNNMAVRETAVLNAQHLTSFAGELNTMKKQVDNSSNALGWAATISGLFGVPGVIVSIAALAEVVGLQIASSMIQDVIDVVQDCEEMIANRQCDLV